MSFQLDHTSGKTLLRLIKPIPDKDGNHFHDVNFNKELPEGLAFLSALKNQEAATLS